MTKFIFERQRLIDLLCDSTINGEFVVVNLSFECDNNGDNFFPAKVSASISKGDLDVLGTMNTGEKEVPGCPSPPGCTTSLIKDKLNIV